MEIEFHAVVVEKALPTKVLFIEFDLFHAFFFQVYSNTRKYSGNCTQCLASEFSGSGWIFGNGFNAFTWLWRLRTSKNQVSILTTSLCPGLQCSPSIIISCIQFSYVWMVPTRTSIVWTPKLYFCSDDICHEFLKDDLEYILRTERFLRYSCRNIFSPEGCLLRSLLKWINADQGSKLLLYWWKQPREKDRCTFNAVLERCSSREALVGIRFFS